MDPNEIADAIVKNLKMTPFLARTIVEHFPAAFEEMLSLSGDDHGAVLEFGAVFPMKDFVNLLFAEDRIALLSALLPRDDREMKHFAVDFAAEKDDLQRWYDFGVLVTRLAKRTV